MKNIVLRPLAVFTVTYFALSCLFFTADTSFRLPSAVIFSFLLFALSLFRIFTRKSLRDLYKKAILRVIAFFLCALSLSSFVYYNHFDLRIARIEAYDQRSVQARGEITEVTWQEAYGAYYTVKLSHFDGKKADFSVTLSSVSGFSEGDIIEFEGIASKIDNSETFNNRLYSFSREIFLNISAEEITFVKKAGEDIFSKARELNSFLTQKLLDMLGKENGGFAAAIVLGNRSFLSDEIERDFTRLGLSHILALSGMHLTVICAAVSALLRRLGKNVCRIASIITVLFYMLITGFSASVTRAGLMLIIFTLCAFFKSEADRFTSLGLAGFIILIIDPCSAGDIGLQLSFACVFAILLYSEKKEELEPEEIDLKKTPNIILAISRLGTTLLGGALITIVILMFILPIQLLYFKSASLISPISSPIFCLLSTFLLWVLPILLLLHPFEGLCGLLAPLCDRYISLLLSLSEKLSRLRGIHISIDYPLSALFCLLLFVCIIAFCVTKKKARCISAVALSLILSVFGTYIYGYNAALSDCVYISCVTSKASEALVVTSDSKSMIIDMGNGYKSISTLAIHEAKEKHCLEIEALVLTHEHNPYSSTLRELFSNNMIRSLYIPEGENAKRLSRIAAEHSVEVIIYKAGHTIEFEDAKITLPPHNYIDRSIQPQIKIQIDAFGESFVYLGGAYSEGSDISEIRADCIWFGDHGPLYKKIFSYADDKTHIFTSENADKYFITYSDIPTEYILGDKK